MRNNAKTKNELIIDILRSGKALQLSEITALMSEITGKKVKMTDISSQLSRLTNSDRKDTGFLIEREKTEDGNYSYRLVKEALDMIPEEMYDLSRKTGKNRFTLKAALEKYPALKKHVRRPIAEKTPKSLKPAKQAPPIAEPPPQDDVDIMKLFRKLIAGGLKVDLNVTIRFS